MLTYETSTELLLKQLIQLTQELSVYWIIFFLILIYFGRKIVAAIDDANSNLATLATNAGLVAANVAQLSQPQQGGATEAQVQAIADAIKTVNNAVIVGTPGTTPIP